MAVRPASQGISDPAAHGFIVGTGGANSKTAMATTAAPPTTGVAGEAKIA
ncbi:MAG: hypothetical protein ACK5LN_14345 [Propioniciclava sp.]